MDEHPLVSIILPTYNRPKLLYNAIESIMAQYYPHFEILVVNDAGEDVKNVVDSFQDSRIHYIEQKENKGPSASRNIALKQAKGFYIAYLDDDDIFYPNHLSHLVQLLQSSGYKVGRSSYYSVIKKIKGKKTEILKKALQFSDLQWPDILIDNIAPTNAYMHEHSCLQKIGYFDETLRTHEDWDFFIRLFKEFPIIISKEATIEYSHFTSSSLSQSHNLWIAPFLYTMQLIHHRYKNFAEKYQLLGAQKQKRNELAFLIVDVLPKMSEEELRNFHPEKSMEDIFESSFLFDKDELHLASFITHTLLDYLPENFRLWKLYGKISYLLEDFMSAVIAFSRALQLQPSEEIKNDLLHTLEENGQHEKAKILRETSDFENLSFLLLDLMI